MQSKGMRECSGSRTRLGAVKRLSRGTVLALMGLGWCGYVGAQEAAAIYAASCASCHTIGGGRLAGPDLKDVTERKDREWLRAFILDPQAKINAGDPYALQLLDEARGVVMPKPQGVSPAQVDALLDLIEAESALEESQFKGIEISMEPFTQADVDRGLAMFTGRQPLANGGPSCISCHTVPELGGLGGGTLGPELGRVYERLQGRAALAAWLNAPATPTMRAVMQGKSLRPEEIHALTALFEDAAKRGAPVESAAAAQLSFLLLGLGGAALVLAVFDMLWKERLRAVRRPLVQASKL